MLVGSLASNFVVAIAEILGMLLGIYKWILIIRVLLTWVNPDPYNPIVRFLYSVTEPILFRIRRTVPTIIGGIDFSPMIVLLVVFFLQIFLVGSLRDLAFSLR